MCTRSVEENLRVYLRNIKKLFFLLSCRSFHTVEINILSMHSRKIFKYIYKIFQGIVIKPEECRMRKPGKCIKGIVEEINAGR